MVSLSRNTVVSLHFTFSFFYLLTLLCKPFYVYERVLYTARRDIVPLVYGIVSLAAYQSH